MSAFDLHSESVGLSEFLDEDFRVASALLVRLAPAGRKIVGRAFDEPPLRLEVVEGLRGEREDLAESEVARAVFGKLNQLAADALVLVRRAHVERPELGLALLAVLVKRDAGDRVLVH